MSNEATESKSDQHPFWQRAIETWPSSRFSIHRFCKQEGLSEPSFYAWRKKIMKPNKSNATPKDLCPSEPFIQVSLPTDKPGGLERVLTSGNTLKISVGADRKTLTDVLSILQQAQLC